MELVQLLTLARRRWLALLAGIVLAVGAAIAVGGAPPTVSTLAWTKVALDTPASELVKSAPRGYDTLPWRALLMSHLMLTDATQRELAQRMHVPQNQVAVVDTQFAIPEVGDMVALKATDASLPTGALYVVTVSVPNVTLPVISVQAMAPDRAGAARLAQAAVGVLESQASPSGSYTSMIRTNGSPKPRLQPFVVQQVAPVRVKREAKSSLPTKGILAALFVFAAWVAGVRLFSRLMRRRPRLAAAA